MGRLEFLLQATLNVLVWGVIERITSSTSDFALLGESCASWRNATGFDGSDLIEVRIKGEA
jgi:hypothetical protein